MMQSLPGQSAAEPLNLRSGAVIGDFTLCRLIGTGAMADVWLAEEKSLERAVALKILRPGGSPDNVTRFLREARAAARLDHPNIVRIYKVGAFSCKKAGRGRFSFGSGSRQQVHYIAEEYIPGLNLRQWLDSHGPLSIRQTLLVIAQTAAALVSASEAAIVHRDIKPENILLSPTGQIKVVDFGLAAMESGVAGDMSLTLSGTTLGTPFYMSPEQADNRSLDVRSDIYSLGVTAYQMLTGRVPFTGSTPIAVLLAHRITPAPPLASGQMPFPPAVEALIARMLAKEPEARFESAQALLKRVRELLNEFDETDNDVLKHDIKPGSAEKKSEFSLFGTDSAEQKIFDGRWKMLESSRILQTTFSALQDVRDRDAEPSKKWNRRGKKLAFWGGFLILAAVLGGGMAVWTPFFNRQPAIQRFETVEEQWVFAAQVGTSAAWEAVSAYFPEEKNWFYPAQCQQARAAMLEGDKKKARRLFEQLIDSQQDSDTRIFGYAGLAWLLASDGKNDEAASLVSELRAGTGQTYNRLTEDVLSQTTQLIRDHQR